jgi:hypothetical protein
MSLGLGLGLGLKCPVSNIKYIASSVQRYITKFNSALEQYIELSSTIELDGDFEVEFHYCGEDADYQALIGSTDGSRLFRIQPGGGLRAYGGLSYIDGTLPITDNKQHLVKSIRSGSTLSLYVDGVLDTSSTSASNLGTMNLDSIGWGSSGTIDSRVYDVLVKSAGVTVLDMPIDEDGTNDVVYNNAATLGAEAVEFTLPVVPDASTAQFGIVAGAYGNYLKAGTVYLVEASWENLTGTLGFLIGDDNSKNTPVSAVNHSGSLFYITTTDSNRGLVVQEKSATGSTADSVFVSVKEIPSTTPYGTRINMTSANTELFTLDEERSVWLGENLWDFGSYTFIGSESQYTLIAGWANEPRIIEGDKYLYKWGCALSGGADSSQVRLRIGSICDIVTGEDASNYEAEDVWEVTSGDDLYVQTGVDPQFTEGTMTVTSIQKVLEIAA